MSLRLTTIEEDRLKHEYVFVHRKAVEVVKVEDDEEPWYCGEVRRIVSRKIKTEIR